MVIESGCPPHHWVIDRAKAPTSDGTCVKCGATKEFKNSTEQVSGAWANYQDAKAHGRLKDY